MRDRFWYHWSFPWGKTLLLAYQPTRVPADLGILLEASLYPTLAIALATLALWLARRLTSERLLGLFGLSIIVFLALGGYYGLFFAFGSENEGTLGFWPLVTYVGGLVWTLLKAGADLAGAARPGRGYSPASWCSSAASACSS